MTSVEDKGLAIGGYESAWLADLVASYVFERCSLSFRNTMHYKIYRDDGLAILKIN